MPLGREFLIQKNAIKQKIKRKILDLCKKNDRLNLLRSRYEEISWLILRNKRSQNMKIKEINAKGKLDFNMYSRKAKKKVAGGKASAARKGASKVVKRAISKQIKIPFFVLPLSNQKVSFLDFGKNFCLLFLR